MAQQLIFDLTFQVLTQKEASTASLAILSQSSLNMFPQNMSMWGNEKAVEKIACDDVASSSADLHTQTSDVSSKWQNAEIHKWKREVVEEHFKEKGASIEQQFMSLLLVQEMSTHVELDSGGLGEVKKEEVGVTFNSTVARSDEVLCDLLREESSMKVKKEYLGIDLLDKIDPLNERQEENLLKEREEDDKGGDYWCNQEIDDAGEAVTEPEAAVICEEVFPPPEVVTSRRLNAVGTEEGVAAGVEVVVKKEEEIDEKSFRSLPPTPKWWRPGAPILCCDGWQSGDTVLRKIKKGKNVSSIILACDLRKWEVLIGNGNNEGNAMWWRIWDRLGKMAADQQVVWRGHSSIGHTVRMDFVFPEEEVAKKFLSVASEMRREVMKEEEVKWQSFSHTEEEVGWGEEPVLREQDIVAITEETIKGRNFFSHFVSCQAVEDEKGQVICRFNNISDLNLLLFNKVKAPNRRVVGNFRSKGTRLMEVDSRKKYRLLSTDGGFLVYHGTTVHGHLARQFNFWVESRSFKGIPHFFLSFPTKLSLMKFFTSREAKAISHLQIDESLVVDVVKREQEAMRMREGVINSQAGIMKQLVKEIKEMRASIANLKEKLWRPPRYTFLRLDEVLRMNLLGEGPRACHYPRLLALMLASPVILGVEDVEDVGIVFRFSDFKTLHRELSKWMGKEIGKKGIASLRRTDKKQRAALIPDPLTKDFEVIVELHEIGLREVSIMEVDNTLEQCSSKVSLHPTALSARLPSICSLINTLQALRRIGQYHKVEVSSLSYYDCSRRFFNNVPCIVEPILLSLAYLAGGLNKLLPCSAIIGVEEDWEGNVVTLVDPDSLQQLFQKLNTSWAALSKMTPPSTLGDNAGLFVINCRAPPSTIINLKEFEVHDADCILAGLCSVASRRRAFVIRVFQDQTLRQAYPKMELVKENWIKS